MENKAATVYILVKVIEILNTYIKSRLRDEEVNYVKAYHWC